MSTTTVTTRTAASITSRLSASGIQKPPGVDGLTKVVGWSMWAVALLCVLGFIGGIAYLVIGMIEGREIHGVKIIGISLVGAVVVGSATTFIATLTGVSIV
ncbi:hypothetical protein [Allobranchiibius sp. GilTou38]|uniref:hypothetical protein n=1 Tax=Allobranchiibius sp. GilTou38 TaxID=2815210 RepID=UPI001AA14287|nr:hypothetical protein [Allobranchiibius sp. GilTou38]MBO1768256.1 hypothetical protein [Allobranchiibius sp. GilTou38]